MNNAELKIKKIIEELKNHNSKKIILFGSRTRGDFRQNSNIDIAVDLDLFFRDKILKEGKNYL